MATISGRVVKRKRKRLAKNNPVHEPSRSFMKPESKQTPLGRYKILSITSSSTRRKQPDRRLQQPPRPAAWPDLFLPLESPYAIQVTTDEQVECSTLCSKCSQISAWLQQNQPPAQYPYALRSFARPRYGRVRYALPKPITSFNHHDSGIALEQSYLEGCHLCTLIWHTALCTNIIAPEEAIKNDHETRLALLRKATNPKLLLHWYRFSESDIGLTLTATWSLSKYALFPEEVFDCHIPLTSCPSPRPLPHFNAETPPLSELHRLHPISTSSQQLLDLAATWIHECDSSHEACQETPINTRKLPTRLVYLGPSRENCNPRLVTTTHTAVNSCYLTLSYCWGGCNTTTLTKNNLATFHQEIRLDILPKTIQDAMYVTQKLGFDWLWVDSLCIIQDDPNDSAREAASMADVYSNCFLTIAALGGSSSSSGLFCQRDPLVYSKCKMFQDCSGIDIYAHLSGYSRGLSLLKSYFERAPLHKRGWVTQERLLSPRTLNFGVTLIWECRHVFQDEFQLFPKEQRQTFKRSFSTPQIGNPISNSKTPLAYQDLYSFWMFWTKLVEFYTKASLTIKGDRTMALTGAITAIERNTGWRNTAGLWEPFLLQELLWRIGPPISSDSEPRFPRVPTWSWFSIDRPVRFWYKRDVRYLSTAKFMTENSSAPRLEKPERETIHLTCNLIPCSKLPTPTGAKPFEDVSFWGDLGEIRVLGPYRSNDSKYLSKQRTYTKSLFFAPISKDHYSYRGLALRKSKSWPGTYERAGVVEVRRGTYDLQSNTWEETLSLKMEILIEEGQRQTIVLV